MNIAMFTNLYLPLVGGIQRSIATFKHEFEQAGHRVLVVTPLVEGRSLKDSSVIEVPAIQNFNGSDFPVAIPLAGYLAKTLDDFAPDLVHSHHPFLLGDTAVRAARKRSCPLVFTYHTMWEHYLHYVPADSPAMKTFVKRMAAEYCNLCDQVIAPCESIATILRNRAVTTPIAAIPTGIDTDRFSDGDGGRLRERLGIEPDAFVAGYIGRLGPEKNLLVVARALAQLCEEKADAQALIVGTGEVAPELRTVFEQAGLRDRLHMPGVLENQDLVDAYHALDVFAFASQSETQGLVLAEAMAAGRPVIAIDAAGARDIIVDGSNGRLLMEEDSAALAAALRDVAEMPTEEVERMRQAAAETGARLSSANCAARALELYKRLVQQNAAQHQQAENAWSRSLKLLEAEWNLWTSRASAAAQTARQSMIE